MSNTLFITVTAFKDIVAGTETYGFIASDNDGSYFDNGYHSMDEFYEDFQTAEGLEEFVRGLDIFFGFDGPAIVSFPKDGE